VKTGMGIHLVYELSWAPHATKPDVIVIKQSAGEVLRCATRRCNGPGLSSHPRAQAVNSSDASDKAPRPEVEAVSWMVR
jgi:hypothetical protein